MKHQDIHWRHRGRGRFGPAMMGPPSAGPPFGGAPFGGPPFGGGRGRKRRGDVRAALLLLLVDEPRNGYQMMQAIEELSGGRWRPSPGSIYPTLAQLEDEGLIKGTERDGTKLFEITEAGQAHLAERHDQAPPWASEDEGAAFTDLRSQIKQIAIAAAQVMQAGDERQVARAGEALAEARRRIYLILADENDPDPGAEDDA